MGMFGSSRPRSLTDMGMTGPMPSALAAPQLQTQPMPMLPQTGIQSAPRRGGGNLRNIAGVLGDALAQASGGQARFLPQMMHDREQQRQLQLQQQQQAEQRAYDESQWRARQDYQRANPEPDAFMRSMVAAGIDPNSDRGRALLSQRVSNMADPMMTVNNGDGTYTLIRTSQVQQRSQGDTTPAAPSAPDTLPPDFDFGGPTQPASGGFR